MNRRLVSKILSLAAAGAVSGCGAPQPVPNTPSNKQQIDTGGLVIHGGMANGTSAVIGAAWHEKNGPEYWVKGLAGSAPALPWKVTHTSDATCNDWLAPACQTPKPRVWLTASGSEVLDLGFACGVVPQTVPEKSGRQSFLPAGSYKLAMSPGSGAWVQSNGNMEAWVMEVVLGASGGTLDKHADYGGDGGLFRSACSESGVKPTHYFRVAYTQMDDLCETQPRVCPPPP